MPKLRTLSVLSGLLVLLSACSSETQQVPQPHDSIIRALGDSVGGPGKVKCEITAACIESSVPSGIIHAVAGGPEPQVKPKSQTTVTGDVSSMARAIESQMVVAYKECRTGVVIVQCRL
tara:strand:- start:5851 stop:6207 length:357 start_codon:yes stop_codon:yes gene_type:complete